MSNEKPGIGREYSRLIVETANSMAHGMHLGHGIEETTTCPTCNPEGFEQERERVRLEREARRERMRHAECPTCTCAEDPFDWI